jgi:hypothetical protein
MNGTEKEVDSRVITVAPEFLRPVKVMRELSVLLSLGETQRLSQHELARKIGVSSSYGE